MKKQINLILLLSSLLLAGCNNNNNVIIPDDNQNNNGNNDNNNDNKDEDKNDDSIKDDENKDNNEKEDDTSGSTKSIVVYFSAQSHTKRVANYISNYVGINTFELTPVNPYTNEDLNYNNSNSRVVKEHNDESLQDIELVSTTIENFESLEYIFLGYPIWWRNAAWPINNFIKNNDFSGKTIIPFATSVSSGIGDSVNNLKALNNTGTWLEGQRFSSSVSETTVTNWVDSLGFDF